jgi:hypothetical protein
MPLDLFTYLFPSYLAPFHYSSFSPLVPPLYWKTIFRQNSVKRVPSAGVMLDIVCFVKNTDNYFSFRCFHRKTK